MAWVAFWAIYGHGLSAENGGAIAALGGAHILVVVVEPLVDLAVSSAATAFRALKDDPLFERRLNEPA